MTLTESTGTPVSSITTISHFWVGSYPFVETTLFIIPPARIQKDIPQNTSIALYDCDGALVNEMSLEFPPQEIGVVEMEQFMGSCKLESGFKYGRVAVSSPNGAQHYCRLHTHDGAALLGDANWVSLQRNIFFPVTFAEDRSYFLAFVNDGDEATTVRCRLFCGKRSPETFCALPPRGSRMLDLKAEFPSIGVPEGGRSMLAYLRLGTKSESGAGVHLIERMSSKGESGNFSAVC